MKNISVAFVTLFLTGCGFQTVDTGHRGVETQFGKVVSDSLPEGLYFYNPFTSDIIQMDTRIQRWDGETDAYTKDVQQAKIAFTVNYRLHQDAVHLTYQQVGVDWSERLMPQIVLGAIKNESGQLNAVDMIASRSMMQSKIYSAVHEALLSKHIDLERLEITNIVFDKNFEKSVEDKVIADQNAIAEQNRTKQVNELAKQTVAKATAEAESMSIRARALEQNAKLVEWEAVQKWNGTLPTMMLGDAVPFIQIKSGQ